MKNLRLSAFFVLVVPALVACPDIVIPPDAIVACGANGDCPAGSTCDDTIDRCVPDDVADQDPVVSGFSVDPRKGGVDTTFTVAFVVDEALGADPVVSVFDGALLPQPTGGKRDDPATPWTFSFTVDGSEAAGDQSVDVTVVDIFGNRAVRSFADVFSVDFAAPTITDPGLDPVIGDPELSFTVRLQGAERLTVTGDVEDDKDLVVTGESVDVDVTFTAGDGRKQLRLEAFDDVGNSAVLDLEVTVDSSVPFSRPTITARAAQTAVKNNDVVDVGGNVTPGSTIVEARLVDEDGEDIATVGGVLVDNVTGALSGSVDMGGLGAAEEVRLVVIVVKSAVASVEAQSRSNALVVDNAAPANATCSLPARTSQANVALALDADDFVDVEVVGDVVDARPFLPLAGGSVTLILSAGEGLKTLTARFRDGAHNVTECEATTTLDTSAPVLSNVTLSPPLGQSAVRSDQTVTVSGTVDVAGATVVSARLLDQGFNFIGDIAGVAVNGVNVSGSFVVDDLVAGAVAGLVVELVVAEGGLQSLPVRSPQLNIDDIPPTDPAVTGPADSASFFVDIDVGGCVGADDVQVSGDLANDDGSFVDLPNDGVITVVLSAGIGDKDLVVVCRDGAFNLSGPDTITINLSTDDVLSLPTLSAPAGQTAIKNGDVLTIGGNGESGATVAGVRLVNVANGNTVQTLPNNVVVQTGTTLSGSFTAAGLVNGQNVALEVLLSARARTSIAANSRSGTLAVDLAVPAAPVAGSLRLVETTSAANDPARLNEAVDNGLAVTGLGGAIVDAGFAELCADAACNTVLAGPVVVDGTGAFVTVPLAHRAAHDVFVRGVDGAKNRGSTTRVVVPRITFTSVLPAAANVDDDVVISFSSNTTLRGAPVVLVDGNAAVLQSQAGNNFVFRYNTLGNEGDGVVVVRVTAEDGTIFAAGSTGTDATTTLLDFTAPTIDAAKITLVQNDPGTADNVTAIAGAVVDALDAAVDVEVKGDGNVVATRVTSADGSFGATGLGDNLVDVVLLTASDDAGNTRTLTLNNDRRLPVLSQLTATAVARDNDVVTVSFRVVDAANALRADPVVTVGGRAATRISGNRAEDDIDEAFVYEFTVDDSLDDEGDNNVAVAVVDLKGNAAAAATSVEIDFTPPVLRNTNPGDKVVWNLDPKAFGSVVDAGSGLAASGTVNVRHCDSTGPCVGSNIFSGSASNAGRDWSAAIAAGAFVDDDAYEMTVTWADQAGNVASVVRDFTYDDVPQAQPTNLQASEVGGVVTLSWTAPVSVAAVTYRIHYDDAVLAVPPYNGSDADEGASPVAVDGALVSVDLNVLDASDHVFAVTGVSAAGESAYSNEVLVTVP